MSVLVEICACSVDDVMESEKGGAQRVELCSAFPLGGLTPSIGTLIECKRLSNLPVMFMIRPRSGGFAYSEAEFGSMQRDMDVATEHGADGFVFGILHGDGTVDTNRTKQLVNRAQGLPTVFHRAFDVTPNPFEALEAIVDLGISRLLTSGQSRSSLEGAGLIRELIENSGDRIEIMAGGGIRPHNVGDLVRRTGCKMVHLSAHTSHRDSSIQPNAVVSFNASSATSEMNFEVIDQSVVAAIVREAQAL